MIYKTYNCNNFNIYTVKTDKFKTCHIEITFSKPVSKETICEDNFLSDMLSENSKNYTTKDLGIRLEELYKTVFYSVVSRVGETLNTSFVLDFINPEFIDEEDYLENVLKLPFEALENPNVTNEEFDLKTFNIVKQKIKQEIESVVENPFKTVIQEGLKAMDKDSLTSLKVLGSLEDLEKITPASLYKRYTNFFKENKCNIYVIGNLDMDDLVSIIKKNFHNRIISNVSTGLYYENKSRSRVLTKESDGNFIQSNLVLIFNLEKLTKKERDIVFHAYNYILGSGGLTSKLYQSLREKNSLCYTISSMYLKYDKLLMIYVGLEKENIKKAISLVKKEIKAMTKGEFSEETLEDCIKNMLFSIDLNLDNPIGILNNYVFKVLDDLPTLEERKELYKEIRKEDIINVAKKVKLNTIYALNGGTNEGN